jgi:glycosyltransferase involved in cell wall biosynthesis
MKVILDHLIPFSLAHGGVQIQIEQTKVALERARIEVEFGRWWDTSQQGDIIHYFGSIPNNYLHLARQRRIPVVLTNFFSETCNRSDFYLQVQGLITRGLLALPGWGSIKTQLHWQTYGNAARIIVGTEAERRVVQTVYGVHKSKISVVPLGLDKTYLTKGSIRQAGNHLISVGTIRDVKRSIELAEVARKAEVPILFIGNPYAIHDPYWQRFQGLIDDKFVLHRNHVSNASELKSLLLSARGFVLYSHYENWSLAAHEAAACGLPVLLPKQKWSLERFGTEASYFSGGAIGQSAEELKVFYDGASTAPAPRIKLYSWAEVAEQLKKIYDRLLSTSR